MLSSLTILLVEESATDIVILYDYLDNLGHKVLVANSAESAIRCARLMKPDLILMDAILTGIDGYEACRRLKTDPALNHIPIYLVSSLEDNTDKSEIFKAGGTGHITKPILFNELHNIVEQQSELVQLRKQLKRNEKNAEESQSQNELDRIIDLVAHDIKSPLLCIRGFAEELKDQFTERPDSDEWLEFTMFILQSSAEADTIIESLVLLKNLRSRSHSTKAPCSLVDLVLSAEQRYSNIENQSELNLEQELTSTEVLSEATLLEELILILFRNFSALTPDDQNLTVSAKSDTSDSTTTLLSLQANTRQLSPEEQNYLLQPLQGTKRHRVRDTNILTLCTQKIIEHLAIKASSSSNENGLTISLSLPTHNEPN